MAKRNEALEAAIEECNKNNLTYRTEMTKDAHIKLFIANCPTIVTISGTAKRRDPNWIRNVRSNVRQVIKQILV